MGCCSAVAAIEVRGRVSFQGPGLLAAALHLSAAPLLARRNVSLPRSCAPLSVPLSVPPPCSCGSPTTTQSDSHYTTSTGSPLIQGIAFTMLLLDYQNVLIQSVLTERFSG